MDLRAYYLNHLKKISFDFGFLAQNCLKPCVIGILKLQFLFLNLSSKFPSDVRVRTSQYPYMDICDDMTAMLRRKLHFN